MTFKPFLCSTNVLEITAALSAVNKIVTEDMIPAVIGDVSACRARIHRQFRVLQALCALVFLFMFMLVGVRACLCAFGDTHLFLQR
jgi:hypothetical protein